MNSTPNASAMLNRLQQYGVAAGAIGTVLSLLSLFQGLDRFMHSYLFAFCYWNGLGLGCMALLMLNYVAGGRWGAVTRRFLEAGALTLPAMFVLFIPIALGTRHLYVWALPGTKAGVASVHPHKARYLTSEFFGLRGFFYFALWIAIAAMLRRWSLEEDKDEKDSKDSKDSKDNKDDKYKSKNLSGRDKLQYISGPGLIVYVLAASFAAFDWTMSLEPDWYSTIYGLVVIVGQGLTALVLCILSMRFLMRAAPLDQTVTRDDFHDFGNLLLVFVMLSAYMSFSQFLIIWSGNLPEESAWYIRRSQGGWQWIAAFLAGCHFLAPFLILLFRSVTYNAARLAGVAALLAATHLCQCYWWVMPSFDASAIPHLSDIAAPLALGGIWLIVFVHFLKRAPLLSLAETEWVRAEVGGRK